MSPMEMNWLQAASLMFYNFTYGQVYRFLC